MKSLTPIILIIISIALYFFQVSPNWAEIKILKAESEQYDAALKVADELKELRTKLQEKLDNFPQEDLVKLERFLPNNFDTIRLTLDISTLAAKRGFQLKNLKTAEVTAVSSDQMGPNQPKLNKGTFGFTFTTSYQNALLFIEDLEKSLRIADITNLKVTPSESGGSYTFTVDLQTYWISQKR